MEELKNFFKTPSKLLRLGVSLLFVFAAIGLAFMLIDLIMFMGFWFILVPVATYFVYKFFKKEEII